MSWKRGAGKGEAPSLPVHIRFCYYFVKCVESMSDNQFKLTVKASPAAAGNHTEHLFD